VLARAGDVLRGARLRGAIHAVTGTALVVFAIRLAAAGRYARP
jgi:hypothetical protein